MSLNTSANLFLSRDAAGYSFDDNVVFVSLANETSALTGSATLVPAAVTYRPGRIVDAFIAVATPALSASGFVSGTVDAQVRINSAAVLATQPSIAMAANSAGMGRRATNAGGGVSAIINPSSASFGRGAMITVDYNARSVGSAAAGVAGNGLMVGVVIRYDAI